MYRKAAYMAAEMVSEARATLRELRATQPNRGLVNILDMDMWGERERGGQGQGDCDTRT